MKNINKKELHQLFAKIKQDNNNFSEFYEKSKKLIYAIAFSILKNKEDSEDVMQKVFLKIWKINKDQLPSQNESSWLYSVTKNEVLNYIRNKKPTYNLENIYYIGVEDFEINSVIEKDTFNRIIEDLDKTEKEIISLKILANLSFKEISTLLNLPIGTIQWKYYKSIKSLKIVINKLGIFIIIIAIFTGRMINKKNNIPNSLEETNENLTNLAFIDYIFIFLIVGFGIYTLFSIINFVKFQQKIKKDVSK